MNRLVRSFVANKAEGFPRLTKQPPEISGRVWNLVALCQDCRARDSKRARAAVTAELGEAVSREAAANHCLRTALRVQLDNPVASGVTPSAAARSDSNARRASSLGTAPVAGAGSSQRSYRTLPLVEWGHGRDS
jgi:hypothetical protein